MGLIIDTSALIEWERRGTGVQALVGGLGAEPVALPSIVWAELLIGVRLAKSAEVAARRRARLEQLRLAVPVIEFTAAIAEHYADISTELRRAGKLIPQNDTIVAATARWCNYGILVGGADEAHFRQVPGLRVETIGT